jgi:hypothetical protein
MALLSVWIDDGNGFSSHLIDPARYQDCESKLELNWRIVTGQSHSDWLSAQAGMLKRIAHRLETVGKPGLPALPGPAETSAERATRERWEHKKRAYEAEIAWLGKERITREAEQAYAEQIEAQIREDRKQEQKRRAKQRARKQAKAYIHAEGRVGTKCKIPSCFFQRGPTERDLALTLAGDHDFITAMFSLYAQGRSRLI